MNSSAREFFDVAVDRRHDDSPQTLAASHLERLIMIPRQPDLVALYKQRLAGLAPLLAEHRAAMDRDRHLPRPLFEALAAGGLFKLWLPRAFGGPELSPLDFMEVVEAAAALDGAVGWLVGNGGGMSRAAGYLACSAARGLLDRDDAFIASATGAVGQAVPVADGYRVTGRWPYASGAPAATAFMGLARVAEPDVEPTRQRIVCCYAPRADVELIDTWRVSGLRGTGSHDFEMRDVFVPSALTHAFPDLVPAEPGLLYRLPLLSSFTWTVATVPLGIARAALDAFAALAGDRTRAGTSAALRERETAQEMFGRSEMAWRAARALLQTSMSELLEAVDADSDRLRQARLNLRAAGPFAGEAALGIVRDLVRAAGATSLLETCPLERQLRDVQAACQHVAMSPVGYVLAGRIGLGLEAGAARF